MQLHLRELKMGDVLCVADTGEDYVVNIDNGDNTFKLFREGWFRAENGTYLGSEGYVATWPEVEECVEIRECTEVQVRDLPYDWEADTWTFITKYAGKYICVQDDNVELWDEIKPKEFCPEKGDMIWVRRDGDNDWEKRVFLMYHNDTFICAAYSRSDVYCAWEHGRAL